MPKRGHAVLLSAVAVALLLVVPLIRQATTRLDFYDNAGRYDSDGNFFVQPAIYAIPCPAKNDTTVSTSTRSTTTDNTKVAFYRLSSSRREIEIQELESHLMAIDNPPLRLLFLHRRDKKNIGDWACTPKWYFDVFQSQQQQDFDHKDLGYCPAQRKVIQTAHEYDGIIIGGGGLLRCSHFWDGTLSVLSKHPGAVLWSAGLNFVLDDDVNNNNVTNTPLVPEYVRNFALYGIRDELFLRSSPDQYHRQLDDVTCMSPLFDKSYPKKKEENNTIVVVVGIYTHHTHPIETPLPCSLPLSYENSDADVSLAAAECAKAGCIWTKTGNNHTCQFDTKIMSNKGIKLEEAIEFLATSDVVVTTSYHGLWWATLLGKPVLLHSDTWVFTKELFFAYPPSMFTGDLARDLLRGNRVYPNALAHCRAQNRQFYLETLRLLRRRARENRIIPPSPSIFLPIYNVSDPNQECITVGHRSRCAATGQHSSFRSPEIPFIDREP